MPVPLHRSDEGRECLAERKKTPYIYPTVDRTSRILLIALFVGMTIASYISLQYNLRITSALVYVIAIVAIAAKTNLRYGLVSALVSSALYNFFLSEPLWKFGIDSYDDVMPLIAFNTTAVFTGVLAGRLSERATAAEVAQARVRALLRMSDKLQQAVSLADIAHSLEEQDADLDVGDITIFDGTGSPLGQGEALPQELVQTLNGSNEYLQEYEGATYHVIRMGPEPIAVVRFLSHQPKLQGSAIELESLVNLIRLAAERCTLLRKQSEIESIRRSEELKTAILSSISHDMRTPLAAISASASSLSSLQGTLDPALQVKLLQTILSQCERLDRFTANLLNIGRLQAGLGEFEREPVDLLDMLGVVLSTSRARFPETKIIKQFASAEMLISANAVMIEQIFVNVLDNACRYSGAGGVVNVLAAYEADYAVVTVTDSGPGIAPDEIPHLFERFFRGSRTSHISGTGLGLAIAQGFVEEFGGTILAESPAELDPLLEDASVVSKGPGTRVTVKIPLRLETGLGERT